MIRPTMKCDSENAVVCKVAPIIMMVDPRNMVFLLPSMLPIQMHPIAPQKQPTLYEAIDMPDDDYQQVIFSDLGSQQLLTLDVGLL